MIVSYKKEQIFFPNRSLYKGTEGVVYNKCWKTSPN
jgi:hypothetical protein